MTRFITALAVAATSTAALALPPPTSWTEQGDAPQTIAGAQQPTGTGSLQIIYGTITTATDVDIYRIVITDEASFHASVIAFAGGDSMLWLFNPDGSLQSGNDDYNGNPLSTIDSTGVLTNGTYYLAITSSVATPGNGDDNSLISAAHYWPGSTQQISGNGTSLAYWLINSNRSGAYQIALTGAQFVPTPGAAALLGLGGLLINRRRRTA